MTRFSRPLPQTEPAPYLAALAGEPYTLFLDSADRKHPDARYSYLLFDPVEVITLEKCGQSDPFKYAETRIEYWSKKLKIKHDPSLPPFQGGAAGLFSYDLGRTIETLPSAATPSATPDLAIGIYDTLIAFDHKTDEAWFISHRHPAPPVISNACEKSYAIKQGDSSSLRSLGMTDVKWQSQCTEQDYKTRTQRIIDYIHAGDVFQVNLSQRFEATLPSDFNPAAHYLHLRKINPAPFAAYMNLGEIQISSASPERFLQLRSGQVETKPIKGTAPITVDPQILINDQKERAENTMIVDLLRNDLSKVCAADSIEVPKLCALESFASVHHLVSTVTGTLKQNKTALDLLRAAFPGGSITGAPKIRAQEIIEELEGKQRGAYCGSIGWIGFNGDMDSNILIRTLIYDGDTVHFNVGGGITAISNPSAEYQETLDKAKSIFDSFSHSDKAKAS